MLGGRICIALADAGVNLAVGYARSPDKADEVAEEMRARGVRAIPVACDVTDLDQIRAAIAATVDEFGGVHILVNDGAYNKAIDFTDIDGLTYEVWDKIIDINLSGPMRTIKEIVKPMRASGGGRIVNISSVAGLGPNGSSIAYAVSKAGLNHLTKCMARGLAPDILVNCVAPGYLEGTLMSSTSPPSIARPPSRVQSSSVPPTRTTSPARSSSSAAPTPPPARLWSSTPAAYFTRHEMHSKWGQ